LVEFLKKIGTSQRIAQLLAVNSSNFSWKKGFVDREINGSVSSALAYLRLIFSNSCAQYIIKTSLSKLIGF
jgi:hypothetical protein